MKMKDSLSSGQHDNQNKGSHGGASEHQIVGGGNHGQNPGNNVGGGGGGHHVHQHPSQNELKLGLQGMTSNLGMMGQMGDKSNQDILKAVSKVNNISFYN